MQFAKAVEIKAEGGDPVARLLHEIRQDMASLKARLTDSRFHLTATDSTKSVQPRISMLDRFEDPLFVGPMQTLTMAWHKSSHIMRDALLKLHEEEGRPIRYSEMYDILRSFCNTVADTLNDWFDNKYKFHAAIKLFYSPKQVLTAARDDLSLDQKSIEANARRNNRLRISISKNSAFLWLDKRDNTCFAHDNLNSWDEYRNESPGWSDFYNATMVVPLRRTDILGINVPFEKFEVAGFLGVDTIIPGTEEKYPRIFGTRQDPCEVIEYMLRALADNAYCLIKKGEPVQYQSENCIEAGRNILVDKRVFKAAKELNALLLKS